MRPARQFTATSLVLCLLTAGAIGVSPVLHRLIEHGGQGGIHAHLAGKHASASHRNTRHPHAHGRFEQTRSPELVEAKQERNSAAIHLIRLAHDWIHQPAGHSSVPADSSSDEPNHEHHTLPQTLLNGLVEQHLDIPLLHKPVAMSDFIACSPETFFLSRDLDAQSASRAPPSFPS